MRSLSHQLTNWILRSAMATVALLAMNATEAQPFNKALSYNAAQFDFTQMPANIVQPITGDATIETWVYWKGTNSSFPRIVDFGIDQNNWVALTAAIPFGSGGPRFAINSTLNGFQFVDASAPLVPNTWNHIAVTIDAATDQAHIYINGTLSGTTPGFTARLSDVGATTNNTIGRSQYPGDPFFDGVVEELRISTVQRYSGASFTVPSAAFASDAFTRALYHFDEGTGQTTADASGNLGVATLGSTGAADDDDPDWFPTILPVRLTEFTVAANAAGRFVDVKWTASLDEAGSFEIERSADGARYAAITTVSRGSATEGLQNFSFRDLQPLSGRSYYRLKAVEGSRSPVYSRVLPVNFGGRDALLVYPNPVRGYNPIRVELAQPASGTLTLTLRNASGVMVERQQIPASRERIFTFQRRATLSAGTYTLEALINGVRHSQQIVIE